jgi:DNA-directed RNA polymerase subunit RPC12/RpoP
MKLPTTVKICANCRHRFQKPVVLKDPNKEREDRFACPRCFSTDIREEGLRA